MAFDMANRTEPSTRHYDEKLEALLKCAAKIFAEKGFHSTSIRDISRGLSASLSPSRPVGRPAIGMSTRSMTGSYCAVSGSDFNGLSRPQYRMID